MKWSSLVLCLFLQVEIASFPREVTKFCGLPPESIHYTISSDKKIFSQISKAELQAYGSETPEMTYYCLGKDGWQWRISKLSQWIRNVDRGKGWEASIGLEIPKYKNYSSIFNSQNKELKQLVLMFKDLGKISVRIRFLSEANLRSNPYSACKYGVNEFKKAAKFFKGLLTPNVKLVYSPSISPSSNEMDDSKLYQEGVYDIIGGTLYAKYDSKEHTSKSMYDKYYKKMQKSNNHLPYQIDEYGASIYHKNEVLDFINKSKENYPSLIRITLFGKPMTSSYCRSCGLIGFIDKNKKQSYVK